MTEQMAIIELQHNIDLPFGGSVSDEASDMAIKALEKQIPKKPVLVTRGLIKFYPCPNADCSNPNKYIQVYPNQKYCVYCGQKLDWGGEDE